jgi:hypothetical protein
MSKTILNLRENAEHIRVKSIINLRKNFKDKPTAKIGENWDLRTYTDIDAKEYYPYIFSKTLPVNTIHGMPLKNDVDLLLKAIKSGDPKDIDDIKRSTSATRKIENLTAGLNYNLSGVDSSSLVSLKQKLMPDSENMMFEMAEVYSQSLLRNVNFYDIEQGNNTISTRHIGYLNGFTVKSAPTNDMGSITNKTLYRGSQIGCTVGPYISQYLYLPLKYGSLDIEQKYTSELDKDSTSSLIEWKLIQEGGFTASTIETTPNRYVNNGLVLGSIVKSDPLFMFYYNASLISLQNGIGTEYKGSKNNSPWISGGPPSVFESLASVSVEALQAAWFQKYSNLTIRPEVLAQRLHTIQTSSGDSNLVMNTPGYSFMKNYTNNQLSELLNEVRTENTSGTNLLKLHYEQGSPTHPSQPAGHSIVAGACVTVLKAMLDTVDTSSNHPSSKLWPSSVKHSIDGTSLVDYTGDVSELTINGELNKLANNISLGRNWAGVHFRTDADLELGEMVGIAHLIDKCLTYHESHIDSNFNGFTLQKFDGTFVQININGVSLCL